MNGTVKTKTEKGYGFISREGEEKDLFFHSTDLSGVTFDEFRDNIRRWLLATKLRNEVLKEMPQPSDDEAFEFFNQNKQLFMNKSWEEVKPLAKAQMIEAEARVKRSNYRPVELTIDRALTGHGRGTRRSEFESGWQA